MATKSEQYEMDSGFEQYVTARNEIINCKRTMTPKKISCHYNCRMKKDIEIISEYVDDVVFNLYFTKTADPIVVALNIMLNLHFEDNKLESANKVLQLLNVLRLDAEHKYHKFSNEHEVRENPHVNLLEDISSLIAKFHSRYTDYILRDGI